MDVHRVRFIQHPTPSITCFAFSRSTDLPTPLPRDDLRLAIGRTDGRIEIWNPNHGSWIQESIFLPSGEDTVDSLLWTQDPADEDNDGQLRLFSIGSSSNVTEWDLRTGTVKRQNTGSFGEVWCFAAQPRASGNAQDVAVGCGDGTIALLSTADDDLQFKRFLARVAGKKARSLSIAYQKPEVLVAGFADGQIRIFDTRNGSIIRTASLGAGVPGAPKTPLVWKVVPLANGDIASADSNGELRIWDGKLYTMVQRLKGHKGDCLDLVASADGKSLLSGGVDGYVATYGVSKVDKGRRSWAKLSHRRIREDHGPVKALAAYDGSKLSVVMAAGNEPAPTVAPFREFGKEFFRSLPFLPHTKQIAGAPKARLLATWWHNTVHIYKFRQAHASTEDDQQQKSHQLVAKITLDTKYDIRAASMSSSGRLLAFSVKNETKLFELKQKSATSQALALRRMRLPSTFETGMRLLALDTSDRWLAAVTAGNEVHVARLVEEDGMIKALGTSAELESRSRRSIGEMSLAEYTQSINKLAFSVDSKRLVISTLSGYVDSWVLSGEYDANAPATSAAAAPTNGHAGSDDDSSDDDDEQTAFFGQVWIDSPGQALPRLDSAASVLTFRPGKRDTVIILTARHQLYEFDMIKGGLTDWCRARSSTSMPADFMQIRDRAMDCVWDNQDRLWLYGQSFLFMLDVTQSLSSKRQLAPTEEHAKKRRKRDKAIAKHNVTGPESARRIGGSKSGEVELASQAGFEDDEEELGMGLVRPEQANGGEMEQQVATTSGRQTWLTFKYRPILGIALLSSHDAESAEIEVVLVERPAIKQDTSDDTR